MTDTYRTVLVAVVVKGETEKDRQGTIVEALNGIELIYEDVDSWWIAEDDRYEMIDPAYDSAIFVPFGSQTEARKIIPKNFRE